MLDSSAPIASERENPVHEILDLRHILGRRGLHDLVRFFMAIGELRFFARSDVFDQARFSGVLAFVLFGDFLVRGTILVFLHRMAFEAVILTRQGFCSLSIDVGHRRQGKRQPDAERHKCDLSAAGTELAHFLSHSIYHSWVDDIPCSGTLCVALRYCFCHCERPFTSPSAAWSALFVALAKTSHPTRARPFGSAHTML